MAVKGRIPDESSELLTAIINEDWDQMVPKLSCCWEHNKKNPSHLSTTGFFAALSVLKVN